MIVVVTAYTDGFVKLLSVRGIVPSRRQYELQHNSWNVEVNLNSNEAVAQRGRHENLPTNFLGMDEIGERTVMKYCEFEVQV